MAILINRNIENICILVKSNYYQCELLECFSVLYIIYLYQYFKSPSLLFIFLYNKCILFVSTEFQFKPKTVVQLGENLDLLRTE